jgi:outer membrane protein assembly factor BamD (BamD/ComL family)
MIKLWSEVRAHPKAALQIAKDAERKFPKSRVADERSFLAIQALANLGRKNDVRKATERFLVTYPQSPWRERVTAFTGFGPHAKSRKRK